MKDSFLLKEDLLNNKYKIILFIVIKLLNSLIIIITPYLIGNFLDNLIYSNDIKSIYIFTGTLLSILFIGYIINYLGDIIFNKLYLQINYSLNKKIIDKINRSSFINITKYESSYLSQRIIDDSNIIISFILNNVIDIIVNLISLIIVTVSIFMINKKVSFFLICLLPLNYIIYLLFKNLLYKSNFKLLESKNMYFSIVNEDVNNIYFLKSNSLYNKFINRMECRYRNLYQDSIRNVKISNIFGSLQQLPSSLALVGLFWFGGISIINGTLSVGQFTIINSYFNILTSLVTFFSSLSSSYQSYKVSLNRTLELLNIPHETSGNIKLSSDIKSITLDNISLKLYDKYIINDFSYKFEKGNIYSICGKNGCGKSSLINIITNIYQDYKGTILINELNIKDIDIDWYRSNKICLVEQDSIVFSGNLLENIIIKSNQIYNFNIKFLNKNLYPIYNQLHLKYNNKDLNISNNILSGGERQKLSLLRSLLKKCDIYILDEPTNALDQSTIKYLKEYLADLKKDSIIIIITHGEEFNDLVDYKIYM